MCNHKKKPKNIQMPAHKVPDRYLLGVQIAPNLQITLREINIALGNPPFEDIFPIKNGGSPASYVSLPEGIRRCRRSKIVFYFFGG